MIEFLTDWNAADSYFALFVVFALATVVALRLAPRVLARVRDDVGRMTDGRQGHIDRALRPLRHPGWFDED